MSSWDPNSQGPSGNLPHPLFVPDTVGSKLLTCVNTKTKSSKMAVSTQDGCVNSEQRWGRAPVSLECTTFVSLNGIYGGDLGTGKRSLAFWFSKIK